MGVSEITKLADDEGQFRQKTSFISKEFPYLVESRGVYSKELFHWVEENITTDWTCRAASQRGVGWSQFFFKNAKDAMLFKLTWVGKDDPWAWGHKVR